MLLYHAFPCTIAQYLIVSIRAVPLALHYKLASLQFSDKILAMMRIWIRGCLCRNITAYHSRTHYSSHLITYSLPPSLTTLSPLSSSYFLQAVADWIKHAFITKFNQINAGVYDDFARVLRKDILNCHKDKVILDQTYAITKRVGLAQVRKDQHIAMLFYATFFSGV